MVPHITALISTPSAVLLDILVKGVLVISGIWRHRGKQTIILVHLCQQGIPDSSGLQCVFLQQNKERRYLSLHQQQLV